MNFLLQVVFLLLSSTFSVDCQGIRLIGPLEARLGDPLVLLCEASSGDIGQVGIVEGTASVSDRIMEETDNGTHKAFILNPTIKADNGRMLACAVGEVTSPTVTILIIYFESILFTPNPLTEDDLLTLAENSNSVVVNYVISANPVEIQLIRKDGMSVDTERLQVSDSMVMISDASRDDAGMYSLSFSHPDNGSTVFDFILEIEYPPEVSVVITGASCVPPVPNSLDFSCTTSLGMDVVINCSVTANPQATLEVVEIEGNNIEVDINDEMTEGQITVTSLVMGNLGTYQCVANNTVTGTVSTQTRNIELLSDIDDITTSNPGLTTTASIGVNTSPLNSLAVLLTSIVLLFLY